MNATREDLTKITVTVERPGLMPCSYQVPVDEYVWHRSATMNHAELMEVVQESFRRVLNAVHGAEHEEGVPRGT